MRNPLGNALAALVGIAVGFTLAKLVASPSLGPEIRVPEQESKPAIDAVKHSAPDVEPATARRSVEEHPEERAADSRMPSEGLISAALRDYARDGIRAGWRESRNEEIPDERLVAGTKLFEERLRALPQSIGSELAELRTREEQLLEDARRGGAFALLEGMAKGGPPMTALVSDAEKFEALFARGTPESSVRAEPFGRDLTKHLESGKTYEYGVGVFEIAIDFNGIKEVPSDVTIAGAGMNRTLLVLKDDISAGSALRRFSIRDCTVFTNNNYLFDQRRAPATILLERIAVLGFDMGAGSSCALGFAGSPGLVLLARDCRFLGGYGRSPQHGCLMDVRNPALAARLERCRFDRIALELWRLQAGATILFEQCELVDLLDSKVRFGNPEQRAMFESTLRATPGVSMNSTSISFFDNAIWGLEPMDWTVPSRDLNELFPNWKQELQR